MMDTNTTAKKIVINTNTEITTKSGVWTKYRVQASMETSEKFLERAIKLIHSNQTPDEKRARETKYWNNKGWQSCDARRGSRWAYYVSRGYGVRREEKPRVQCAMKKYWRQVMIAIALKEGFTPVNKKSDL
jgi:hypothetical protein